MKIRYLKVLRDITSDYAKNAMLVLAIALGVFGIGCILGGYVVVRREMTANYRGTLPASATIELEDSISRSLVDSVKRLPILKEADRRATLTARMNVNDKWYPILLFVIDDFHNLRISKFHRLSGPTEPALGSMLVERTALSMMEAQEGATITVKTRNGSPKPVRIAGIVHDPALAPAWQEQAGYGYITLATLRWLGENHQFDQLKIQVASNEDSAPHITDQARMVSAWLEKKGYKVHEIQVPPPNRHPHQSQMEAVMTIFIVFSYLILLLGSILVATSMATLMVKQVRQIGVMKTIGATSGQIAGLYLVMLVILCMVALAVSIPLSRLAASVLYSRIATLLNIELTDASIPNWVPLLQVATGMLIPVLVVAFPVIRGSRLPVRQALDNYGVSQSGVTPSWWFVRLASLRFLSETFLLSLRNVFRQRTRLAMTLGLLAAGGAMFMTALNVSSAWDANLSRIYTQRLYDLEIRLDNPMQVNKAIAQLKNMAGIKQVEIGSFAPVSIAQTGPYAVSHTYPDKGHGSFTVLALPVPTRLLNPTVVEGHWLNRQSATDVVLNQLARRKGMKLGDTLLLSVGDKPTTWRIIGFTEDVGSAATAYVSIDALARYIPSSGCSAMLRIAFANRDRAFVKTKINEVENRLERENIAVRSSVPVWLLHNAIAGHMRILINSLMAMAILMALVGTLGLLSTMSMNMMERTREIGVMRALGATPSRIRNLIVWEGLTIGAFSIFLAFVLSLLLSTYLGQFIGNMAFRTPLSLAILPLALGIWVILIVVGSYLATLFPARRANRLTTREALAYE
ncbi:FtsX-like permease family protein [Spirosoma sp. SC4-14]|uniref:FtsX-like permease family protein n=1 Tax=Spirosoma sp. SC4-14 TaxID=3128900 RepID=UPI0030D37F26